MRIAQQQRAAATKGHLHPGTRRPGIMLSDLFIAGQIGLETVSAAILTLKVKADAAIAAESGVALNPVLVKPAIGRLDFATCTRSGIGTLQQDRAAGGIAPKQCPLRTF